MIFKTTSVLLAAASLLAVPAAAQSTECEVVILPVGSSALEGQFSDAGTFLESVYDEKEGHLNAIANLPIRAVICRRDSLLPTMRDLPILKTGLSLSLSQDFESSSSGLLTLYDAGSEYKADYSGPKLSLDDEMRLRDTLEIFNFQKTIK